MSSLDYIMKQTIKCNQLLFFLDFCAALQHSSTPISLKTLTIVTKVNFSLKWAGFVKKYCLITRKTAILECSLSGELTISKHYATTGDWGALSVYHENKKPQNCELTLTCSF